MGAESFCFLRSPLEIYYVLTLLLYTYLNAVMLRYLYRNRRIMNCENYERKQRKLLVISVKGR